MWPFKKKPSPADAAIAVMDDAIDFAADRWLHFCRARPMRADVPLVDRIGSFFVPFEDGLKANFPALAKAPGPLPLLIVAFGIKQSGTHTQAQIEQALGLQMPNR